MSKNEIFENIGVKLQELSDVENNRILLLATIFTRKMEELKKDKMDDLEQYIQSQLAFYKRNEKKYEKEIKVIKSKYETMISEIINNYNGYYIYLQNENSFAKLNQKIAIANLVTSQNLADRASNENNKFLEEKSSKKVFATAQKKLNYDVIIDETYYKLEECLKECENSINSIFTIANNKMVKEKDGFLSKIIRFFSIKFGGDKNFKKYVLDEINLSINRKNKETREKCSDIKITMLTSVSQLEIVRKDLNIAFNQALNQI